MLKMRTNSYIEPFVEVGENKTVRIPKDWLDRWEKRQGDTCTGVIMFFEEDRLVLYSHFGELLNETLSNSASRTTHPL